MAFAAVSFLSHNYRDFKNYWLKVYDPGTTTPKVMAIDTTGVPTVAKLEINADGFIKSAGGAIVTPHIQGAYDAWLFPTEAEADANDTTNAERIADNLEAPNSNLINDLSQAYEFPTVAAYKAFTTAFPVGKVIHLLDRVADFTVISGTGTGNDKGIIASDQVSQSASIVLPNSDPKAFGATGGGVVDDTTFIVAADAVGKVHITDRYLMTANHTFLNKVLFGGGAIIPQTISIALDLPFNDTLTDKNFGAVADATIDGEVVNGTDDYIAIQSALFTCARTNGKMTFRAGGGDRRCDTGLVNTVTSPSTGSCSIIGKGLLGFRLLTAANITMLHLGGSAQTIKRIYVLFSNPTAALTSQFGVRFASDDFQWSQSVIEQVWVQNPHRGFIQENETGTFGTIFLNSYRNLQVINNRDWGVHFNSKNGSTTIHLDTFYVKCDGIAGKGIFARAIKDIITTNLVVDNAVNGAIDFATINQVIMTGTAIESCKLTSAASLMVSLNSTTNIVTGFTETNTTIDVGGGNNGRMLGVGSNATAGTTIAGYVEIGAINTSGNKFRASVGTDVTVEVDHSIAIAETSNNGFHSSFVFKGKRVSSSDAFPAYANTFPRGEEVFKNNATAGASPGFQKVDALSPGTWKAMAALSA